MSAPAPAIRCVVWDLDGTLLDGVLLESAGSLPAIRPGPVSALRELHRRGIVHSIASRNPPELAAAAVGAAGLGVPFLAPQYGWGAKSAAIRRVAAALGLHPDTFAFVDDDRYQRAEVAAALPQVLVLRPAEVGEALSWPRFSPPVVTEAGRQRAQSYLDRLARDAARTGFGGSLAEFRAACRTTVTLRPARPADLPRLVELATRTRQFHSRGPAVRGAAVAGYLASDGHRCICAEVRDRYGDDGLVGAAVVAEQTGVWTAELVMVSCRATGRGVLETLLGGLLVAAAQAGASRLRVPVLATDRNLPLRLGLRAAGFTAAVDTGGRVAVGGQLEFSRPAADKARPPAGVTVLSEPPAPDATLGGHRAS